MDVQLARQHLFMLTTYSCNVFLLSHCSVNALEMSACYMTTFGQFFPRIKKIMNTKTLMAQVQNNALKITFFFFFLIVPQLL